MKECLEGPCLELRLGPICPSAWDIYKEAGSCEKRRNVKYLKRKWKWKIRISRAKTLSWKDSYLSGSNWIQGGISLRFTNFLGPLEGAVRERTPRLPGPPHPATSPRHSLSTLTGGDILCAPALKPSFVWSLGSRYVQ